MLSTLRRCLYAELAFEDYCCWLSGTVGTVAQFVPFRSALVACEGCLV